MNTSLRRGSALLVPAVALGLVAFVWWRSSPAPADLAVRAESTGGAGPRDDARLAAPADEVEPALDAARGSEPERVAFEADGALVFDAAYAPTGTGDTVRVGVQVLASGRHTVEAETSGGLAGSAAFEVDASAVSAPTVEMELRR